MNIVKISTAMTIALALAACQDQASETVTVAGQDISAAAAKFMKDSNGNWQNTQAGIHAYISSGTITINKMSDGEVAGSVTGYYRSDMAPNTSEVIQVSQVSGSLAGVNKAALVSKDGKIILEMEGKAYPLVREERQAPARNTAPTEEDEAEGEPEGSE